MSTIPRHAEPEIDAFLAIGGYADIEEWMADSDYEEDPDGPTGWLYEGEPIWPTDAIAGAMEACQDDDVEELDRLITAITEMAVDGHTVDPRTTELVRLYNVRLGLA